MSKPLLVTHRFKNVPLIIAMQDLGVKIVFCNNLHDVKINLHNSIGYFGSLFTELKKPLQFILLLYKLNKEQTPYIFWNRDAPWHCGIKKHRKLLLTILKPADIYLAHSLQDATWFTRNEPTYLPNAAQNKYIAYNLPRELINPSYYKYDVSFIGAIGNMGRLNCRNRKSFLDAVKKIISSHEVSIKFLIIDTYKHPLAIDKQLAIIKKSKVNLNIGAMCDLPNNRSWGLPERAFGIPATGGFLLTDWRESIVDTFPENKCDYFHTPNECADKIIYYLRNFRIARMRAEALHNTVINNHTYDIHARKVVDLITSYK